MADNEFAGADQLSDAQRSIAAHVTDYDWDGTMGAGAREIAELLSGEDCQQIAQEFWTHYLSGPAARHMGVPDPASLERQHARSARYIQTKYSAPFDDAWRTAAIKHADMANGAAIPLAVLLTSLAFAHSRTLAVIEARIEGDSRRMRRYADVVQRLALIEADVMSAYLARVDQQRVAQERGAHARSFHEHIAGAIDGAAELGERVRAQASTAAMSASAMIGRGGRSGGRR